MHRARKYARKIARDSGYNPDSVSGRVMDMQFDPPPYCYIVVPGIVVYEDEPATPVSLNHRPGRFRDAPAGA